MTHSHHTVDSLVPNLIVAHRDFARAHPVATKRTLRPFSRLSTFAPRDLRGLHDCSLTKVTSRAEICWVTWRPIGCIEF
jgi:hypothetical protein